MSNYKTHFSFTWEDMYFKKVELGNFFNPNTMGNIILLHMGLLLHWCLDPPVCWSFPSPPPLISVLAVFLLLPPLFDATGVNCQARPISSLDGKCGAKCDVLCFGCTMFCHSSGIVRLFRLFFLEVLLARFSLLVAWVLKVPPSIWVFGHVCIHESFSLYDGKCKLFLVCFGLPCLRPFQHCCLTFIFVFPLVVSCSPRLGWRSYTLKN